MNAWLVFKTSTFIAAAVIAYVFYLGKRVAGAVLCAPHAALTTAVVGVLKMVSLCQDIYVLSLAV
jgi:hypothetical protein